MKLTAKGKYGIEALLLLATYPVLDYVSLQKIATQRNIPVKFLEQIFRSLKKANILESTRGKHGGYRFCTSPTVLTPAMILQQLNSDFDPAHMSFHDNKQEQLYLHLHQEIDTVLSRYTLAQLAIRYQATTQNNEVIDFVV